MSFKSNLIRLRKKKCWSQYELSKRLGIARTTYAGYENGSREPDIETLIKLAQLFDVTVDYLLGNDEENFVYPESEIERVITETEKHYGVILRYDHVVYEAMRQLILGIAKGY